FTATVAAVSPGAGTPTGTVTFSEGSATLGTATLNGGGVATFMTSFSTPGTHTITAAFAGDTNFASSTGTAPAASGNPASATTTISATPTSSSFGQLVTFTATVSPVSPSAGTVTGGGTVTFMEGTTALGTVSLSNGMASFPRAGLAPGSHTVTAVFSGNS